MADKKGLQKIGLQIPKIVLKAAGNDPKRLKKIRDLFGKKKQLKFPGMKIGGGVANTAGAQSALGRLEKSGMKMNTGGIKTKPKVVKIIGVGKAKNYPGIKKIIEMNKKGKKRFSAGGMVDYYKDII